MEIKISIIAQTHVTRIVKEQSRDCAANKMYGKEKEKRQQREESLSQNIYASVGTLVSNICLRLRRANGKFDKFIKEKQSMENPPEKFETRAPSRDYERLFVAKTSQQDARTTRQKSDVFSSSREGVFPVTDSGGFFVIPNGEKAALASHRRAFLFRPRFRRAIRAKLATGFLRKEPSARGRVQYRRLI